MSRPPRQVAAVVFTRAKECSLGPGCGSIYCELEAEMKDNYETDPSLKNTKILVPLEQLISIAKGRWKVEISYVRKKARKRTML